MAARRRSVARPPLRPRPRHRLPRRPGRLVARSTRPADPGAAPTTIEAEATGSAVASVSRQGEGPHLLEELPGVDAVAEGEELLGPLGSGPSQVCLVLQQVTV